jgi:osmoprotectant transport system permease protein
MLSPNFIDRLNELPENLSSHLRLTIIALLVGVAVSVPLAVWLVKQRRLRYPVLTGAGVIQTIPSLALLALMVPIIDKTAGLGLGIAPFGFYPAVIALTLYSVLPILRNTVTGILGVDRSLTEAARGLGMTPWQVLMRVELPLAAPVIVAGIRTATVWVVGIATLATPVGQRCLGNYIFTGLQTRNWVMLMFGVVSAAALAIVLDLLIGGVQKAVEERRRGLGGFVGACLILIGVGGLISPNAVQWMRTAERELIAADEMEREERAEARRVIRIGSKTFTEQYILAALIERTLQQAGFATQRTDSLGSIVIFDALARGELDVYVEYTGTVWANTMRRDDVLMPWRVMSIMDGWLAETFGIRALGSLGFENAYALAMRRAHADELGIRTISDLATHSTAMRIGGDYEFFGRPEWSHMRSAYGLNFRDHVSYDSTFMYEAVAAGEVDVISAFSTDGRIASYDLLVLEDNRHTIPPYDAVILLSPGVADRRDVAEALRALIEAIPPEMMRQANHMVDRETDRSTIEQAAQWLHEQIGGGAD